VKDVVWPFFAASDASEDKRTVDQENREKEK
jgi:hypothetical protein